MTYQVQIVNARPTLLAAVRSRTTQQALGTLIPQALAAVYVFLKTAPVRQQGHNVVVYLDAVMNVEIGIQVSAEFDHTATILCSATPGGTAAKTLHLGPYSALPQAHAAVRRWGTENSRELAGPNWEVYGDWHDDPQKLRTDVYYLLKDS